MTGRVTKNVEKAFVFLVCVVFSGLVQAAGKARFTTAQPRNLGAQVGLRHVQRGDGNHGLRVPAQPAARGRPGNAHGGGDADIACLADQITEPVVVDLLTDVPLSHPHHLHRGQPGREPAPADE